MNRRKINMDIKSESEPPGQVDLIPQLSASSESQAQPNELVLQPPSPILPLPTAATSSATTRQISEGQKATAGRELARNVLGPELLTAPSLSFLLPQAWKLSRAQWEELRNFLTSNLRAVNDAANLKQFMKERLVKNSGAAECSSDDGAPSQPYELGSASGEASAVLDNKDVSSADHVFTLLVGPHRTAFDIPGYVLSDAPESFKSGSSARSSSDSTINRTYIHLTKEHVHVIALLTEWLLGKGIPYYNPYYCMDGDITTGWDHLQGYQTTVMTWLPSMFDPDDPMVNMRSSSFSELIEHVCCMKSYARLSNEELRFIETTPGQGQQGTYLNWLQKHLSDRKYPTMVVARDTGKARPPLYQKEEIMEILCTERILDDRRVSLNVRGEYLQYLLVRVLSIAERYQWESLFNDALDAYREGERHMNRDTPLTRQVEIIFDNGLPQTPLHHFMADYAFYCSRHGQDRHGWVKSGLQREHFLNAVVERHEGRIAVPGFNPNTQTWDEGRSPLAQNGSTYHIHDGQHWCFNQWSAAGQICPCGTV